MYIFPKFEDIRCVFLTSKWEKKCWRKGIKM